MSDGNPTSAAALARLTDISRALTYAVSLDEVLEITVDCAGGLLESDRVVLMLRDEGGLLQIRASRGVEGEEVEEFREPLDETLISRLTSVLGPEAEERFLGVPLVVRGSVTGLLAVLRPPHGSDPERGEWLLSAIADQAAVALDNAGAESTREELRAELDALEEVRSQREDALRMVGHDLRSPLNALQGYVHLLASESYGPINDAQRNALERLAAVGRHLDAMVGNVLDMGELTAGTLRLARQPVAVARVVDEARSMVALAAADRDIRIEVETPDGLEVSADPDRLRQVLVQLLDNAVKYGPAGSVVRIEAAREDGPERPVAVRVSDQGEGVPPEVCVRAQVQSGEAHITVTDNGIGIEPDYQERIFTIFQRLHTRDEIPGTGLGLSLVRKIVRRHGGDVLVTSLPGEGTSFRVKIAADLPDMKEESHERN